MCSVVGELACERPERFVDPLSLVQSRYRAGPVATSDQAVGLTHVAVATSNQVLLNHVECGPEIGGGIAVTDRREQLLGTVQLHHWLVGFPAQRGSTTRKPQPRRLRKLAGLPFSDRLHSARSFLG